MALSLKTRVLLGLAAVCMCIVAAPLPVPAEAPVTNGSVASADARGSLGPAASEARRAPEEARGLRRSVVPNLPFTGLDVLTLLGVAAALTLMAVILRWLSTPR